MPPFAHLYTPTGKHPAISNSDAQPRRESRIVSIAEHLENGTTSAETATHATVSMIREVRGSDGAPYAEFCEYGESGLPQPPLSASSQPSRAAAPLDGAVHGPHFGPRPERTDGDPWMRPGGDPWSTSTGDDRPD